MPATTQPASNGAAVPANDAGAPVQKALPTSMEAVRAERYGAPGDVLRVSTVPRPSPGKGEVLVRVEAAGLSRAALHLTTGTPYLLRLAGFGLRRPKDAVGIELSGTVAALGSGVTRLAVGDPVFGYAKGTCAGFAVAKEDKLAVRPAQLSAVDAAALADSASTALQAVRDHGQVEPGQQVLVLGGSGGVGSFAVQIAKALGATVTATASTAKVEFVRGLGADHVIDHCTQDPLDVDQPYRLIVDIGGNRSVKGMLEALAPTGTLVIVGGEGGGNVTGGFQRQLLAPLRGMGSDKTVTSVMAKEHHRYLDDLAELVLAGQLRPAIDQTHPLDQAVRGLDRMEAGTIRGKDVVALA